MSRQPSCAVHTGMHTMLQPGADALRAQGYSSSGRVLHLLLRPHTGVQEFEELLREPLGISASGRWFTRSANVGTGLVIGGAALMFLALIDLFSELIGVIVSEQRPPSQWHLLLLVATFLIGAAIVSFAPQLLAGDDSRLRRLVSRWFDTEERTISRINKRLKTTGQTRFGCVVIWNAAEPTSLGVRSLLACFDDVALDLELRVHGDELALVHSMVEAGQQVSIGVHGPHAQHWDAEQPNAVGDGTSLVLEASLGWEATLMLRAVLAASTVTAASDWRDAIRHSGAFAHGSVSTSLAASFFVEHATDSEAVQGLPAEKWLHRFIADYRILQHGYFEGELRYVAEPDVGKHTTQEVSVADTHERLITGESVPNDAEDVVRAFIRVLHVPARDWSGPGFERLLNAFVALADNRAHYRGFQVLAQVIKSEIERSPADRRLLPALRLPSLMRLQEVLGTAGEQELAIRIARWLAPYTGRDGAIQRARLLEKRGRYDEALRECNLVEDVADPLIRQLDAGEAARLGAEDLSFVNDFCRTQAWLRISAEREDPGWAASVARTYMHRLDQIADAWPGQRDPILTHERQNYWALLHEWEGDRHSAIRHHRFAIELPAVPINKVLGSTINMGRTMRDLAMEPVSAAPESAGEDVWRRAREQLREAEDTVLKGYEGKMQIGDNNDVPIGAHNLALTRLYLAGVASRLGEDPTVPALAGLEASRHGLEVLASTGSVRKWQMLLEEGRLAAALAGVVWQEPTPPSAPQPLSRSDQNHMALAQAVSGSPDPMR